MKPKQRDFFNNRRCVRLLIFVNFCYNWKIAMLEKKKSGFFLRNRHTNKQQKTRQHIIFKKNSITMLSQPNLKGGKGETNQMRNEK
jgi:hypothetical protein